VPSPDELDFRWLGGRLSLNFTATVGERWRGCFERLREPADLARWFVEAGLTREAVPLTAVRLTQARSLREALYHLFTDVRTAAAPDVEDLALVNRWATRAVPGAALHADNGALTLAPPPVDAAGLLTMVARDGVDLLAGRAAHRIKECGRHDCALLFLDDSPAAARRWCSMEACGARSKMAAYRQRHNRETPP